jgi:hypothetical protein
LPFNEDVALAELIFEILCYGQRVRGAVIPPVVDKDFARHVWIMAWPPRKNPAKKSPSKKDRPPAAT